MCEKNGPPRETETCDTLSPKQNNPPSPLQPKGQTYSQDVHEKTNTDEITDGIDLSICLYFYSV